MKTLVTRAGEAFAHRAEAIPSDFAARLIESARDTKIFCEDWAGSRVMLKVAQAMGGKATKASVRLFLPFVDDAATRPYALQLLTWVLWEDYAYSDPTFFAKEPIATPDEFLRLASHVGAVDDLDQAAPLEPGLRGREDRQAPPVRPAQVPALAGAALVARRREHELLDFEAAGALQ